MVDDTEHKGVAATTGSAIGLSAIASFIGLCCIGPWQVVDCSGDRCPDSVGPPIDETR